MTQQIQPQETPIPYEQLQPQQVAPAAVQAMWVSQAIGILMAIGMVAYLLADVLKAATGVIRK